MPLAWLAIQYFSSNFLPVGFPGILTGSSGSAMDAVWSSRKRAFMKTDGIMLEPAVGIEPTTC